MRHRTIAVVLVLAAVAACAPGPTAAPSATPTPLGSTEAALEVLRFTEDELQALLAAGFEIQKGLVPSRTLTAAQLAALAGIGRTLTAAVCPPTGTAESCARLDVDAPRCLDRAGEIVAWRLRERPAVDRKLFIAAMGVSVTGREFPTFPNLVRFCRDMARLDRPAASPTAPRS